nr:type I toxin-antitoxin system SymE family toxin [Photorhabdus hainanensis]
MRQAGFNTGGQITVKVMDGCLVLIPDSEATQQQHQQYQRQQGKAPVNSPCIVREQQNRMLTEGILRPGQQLIQSIVWPGRQPAEDIT